MKKRADRSVNIELVNCGLNSLKLSMRRSEKKGKHREKRKNIATIIIFFWKNHLSVR